MDVISRGREFVRDARSQHCNQLYGIQNNRLNLVEVGMKPCGIKKMVRDVILNWMPTLLDRQGGELQNFYLNVTK